MEFKRIELIPENNDLVIQSETVNKITIHFTETSWIQTNPDFPNQGKLLIPKSQHGVNDPVVIALRWLKDGEWLSLADTPDISDNDDILLTANLRFTGKMIIV